MNIRAITARAAKLRADLAMLPTAEALALSARTVEADGPFGEAARDLHGLRNQLNALYAEQDETFTLYRTTDGRVFERLGEVDAHRVQQDALSLEVLTARVVSVRPYADEGDAARDQAAPASDRVTE